MRIAIREQLALLVFSITLLALAIVSIPTWLYVDKHIASNLRNGLSLTASLKASRITSLLELVQTSCYTMGSRLLVQQALSSFYRTGEASWDGAAIDINSALAISATTGLLQVRIYSRNSTGNPSGLLNLTAAHAPNIVLPYTAPDGSPITLGDAEYGYPRELYPNITYVDLERENTIRHDQPATAAMAFPNVRIARNGGLLLGPLIINETMALMSVSVPIRDNDDQFILGYMTVVAMATNLIEVRDSREGLDESGMVLILGPSRQSNRFDATLPPSNETYTPPREPFGNLDVHFVLPPDGNADALKRHTDGQENGDAFTLKEYPAALDAFSGRFETVNNASAMLHTHNEHHIPVSVGFARTQTPLVNWTVIVEKSKKEARQPISTLSDILLATVFGTAALLALIVLPCAHIGVMPIRKLKAATEKSMNPPGYEDYITDSDSYSSNMPPSSSQKSTSKGIIMTTISRFMGRKRPSGPPASRDHARHMFKIPGKVEVGRHFIKDELTELTHTFNMMSDELVKQYMLLDDKVAERTKELNESKKAAEAANESKTLFIANISHELKTPLNGILGLCAVCMEESDINRIKQSLKVVYGSGDLLLHLLEDLLSFSKNQIGHQITVEPKVFRLADVRSQILAIFDKQASEGHIDFSVNFSSSCNLADVECVSTASTPAVTPGAPGPSGPFATAAGSDLPHQPRLEDCSLWGDQHRILQVIINLVGNSLKFTPSHGKVEVRINCVGEDPSSPAHHHRNNEDVSRSSSMSKTQSKASAARRRHGSSSAQSTNSAVPGRPVSGASLGHTALTINPMEPKANPMADTSVAAAAAAAWASNAFMFEFVVEDTGPGIPLHLQDKVFEPFVQGDPGLSKKFGGTGLGLSICQQLAGLMGGSIELSSVEGVGTTFTMQIPLRFAKSGKSGSLSEGQATAAELVSALESAVETGALGSGTPTRRSMEEATGGNSGRPSRSSQPRLVGLSQPFFSVDPGGPELAETSDLPSPSASVSGGAASAAAAAALSSAGLSSMMVKDARPGGGNKLRVLVADDNSTNIEVVRRMLKLEDISDVTIATDGQEAYELVKSTMDADEPFDVIFMDVQMPNVNGIESTRLIRSMGFTSPIVALTAFSEESNVRDCMDSGMNEFLSKPIRRPALKQVLQRFATIPEEPESPTLPVAPTSPSATSPTSPNAGNSKRVGAGASPSLPPALSVSDDDEHTTHPGTTQEPDTPPTPSASIHHDDKVPDEIVHDLPRNNLH